jgi:hypothetical protein
VLHAANVAVTKPKARAVNSVRRANHGNDDMSLPSLQHFRDLRPKRDRWLTSDGISPPHLASVKRKEAAPPARRTIARHLGRLSSA